MTLERNKHYRFFILRYDVAGKLPSNYFAEDTAHTASLKAHSYRHFNDTRLRSDAASSAAIQFCRGSIAGLGDTRRRRSNSLK